MFDLMSDDERRMVSKLLREFNLDNIALEPVQYDEMIHSDDSLDIVNELSKEQLLDHLKEELKTMDDTSKTVLEQYFGLGDGEPQLLEDIKEATGYKSRASINNVLNRAVEKLRRRMKVRGHEINVK